MTIKRALSAKLQCPVSDDTLEVLLADRGLDGAGTYSETHKSAVDLATMDGLFMIYTQPDVVEGGYQLSHPEFLRKIKERLIKLATDNGATDILDLLVEKIPTVTVKNIW